MRRTRSASSTPSCLRPNSSPTRWRKAAALAAKPRAALLATRRLMRGDAEALKARMAEETHAFSAALASPEAHAAFRAFLSAGRK